MRQVVGLILLKVRFQARLPTLLHCLIEEYFGLREGILEQPFVPSRENGLCLLVHLYTPQVKQTMHSIASR